MSKLIVKTDGERWIRVTDHYADDPNPIVSFDVFEGEDPTKLVALMNIPADQAHALADWIKANVPVPPKPTFKEQFDALPMGAWFVIEPTRAARIKVGESQYFHTSDALKYEVTHEYGHETITQINPEEASQ